MGWGGVSRVQGEGEGGRLVESATKAVLAATLERRSSLLLVVDDFDALLRVRVDVLTGGGSEKVDAIIVV